MVRRKKHFLKTLFLFIFLAAACIAAIAAGSLADKKDNNFKGAAGEVFIAIRQDINRAGSRLLSFFAGTENTQKLMAENRILQEQLDRLKFELATLENSRSRLDELEELLALKHVYSHYPLTGANIIFKDSSPWFNRFIIDKGSNDGIKADMNVIAAGGLIGIVTETGPNYASVSAIIDDRSSVSAMSADKKSLCIVSGDLQLWSEGLLNVGLISDKSSMSAGDRVITSDISDKYMPGLTIGTITAVEKDSHGQLLSAKLKPAADFGHLSHVLIITRLKEDML